MKRLDREDTVADQSGPATTAPHAPRAAVPPIAPTMPSPGPVHATNGSHGPVVEGAAGARPPRSRLPAPLVLLRPHQWVKNVFVLIVPLALDAAALWDHLVQALVTVAAFTAASSAVYVLNDWLDRKQDRLHPVKRHRPLAGGRIGPFGALLLGAGCLAVTATSAALLPPPVRAAIAGYLVLNLAYCLALKHYPLVDVSVVAIGFVLRAVAGCLAVAAPFSPTLIICVYCACLLMALGKRRHELTTANLRGQAAAQRPALSGYSVPLLDQLLAVLLATTLISYELFILSASHPHAAVLAVVTVPFAIFALSRYMQLVSVHRSGGEPGRDVFADAPLVINAVLWVASLAVGRLA